MKSILVVTLLLLAGCAGASTGTTTAPGSQGTSSGSGTTGAQTPTAAPLMPKELYNDTVTFPSARGGSAGSGTFTLPAGYGNLTIAVTSLASCPGYAKDAAIAVTGPADLSIPLPIVRATGGVPVDDPAGYALYGCSINGITSQAPYSFGTATVTITAKPGSWTLAAAGEFTGTASVVVTAQP